MKCLVSCGPTFEPLDQVRRLTNFSTGKLGTELANFLSRNHHEVLLLRGEQSTYSARPEGALVETFTTTEDLGNRFHAHAKENFQAIFHAAAVSDFRFGKIWKKEPDGSSKELSEGKIGTREGLLLAELVPTEKILPRLREWFGPALIIGWKYEVDGSRAGAVERGARQTRESQSDFCVLNGPAYGTGYGLIHPGGKIDHCYSENELHSSLLNIVQRELPKREGL